jgi:hypothetical protein
MKTLDSTQLSALQGGWACDFANGLIVYGMATLNPGAIDTGYVIKGWLMCPPAV